MQVVTEAFHWATRGLNRFQADRADRYYKNANSNQVGKLDVITGFNALPPVEGLEWVVPAAVGAAAGTFQGPIEAAQPIKFVEGHWSPKWTGLASTVGAAILAAPLTVFAARTGLPVEHAIAHFNLLQDQAQITRDAIVGAGAGAGLKAGLQTAYYAGLRGIQVGGAGVRAIQNGSIALAGALMGIPDGN